MSNSNLPEKFILKEVKHMKVYNKRFVIGISLILIAFALLFDAMAMIGPSSVSFIQCLKWDTFGFIGGWLFVLGLDLVLADM